VTGGYGCIGAETVKWLLRNSNASVVVDDEVRKLYMNRHWQGSSRKNHQIMAAHVPMLVAPQSRRILVVGVGAGQTPSRFLMYDVDALHRVDIVPVIFDFIEEHFDSDCMSDSRIERISDDGRNYVASLRSGLRHHFD